jgi:hypothetical protein
MQSKLIIPTRNYKNVKKQQDYCSVGYAIRQHKVSGSVIRNSYLLIKIGSKRIENPYIKFRQITNQPAH